MFRRRLYGYSAGFDAIKRQIVREVERGVSARNWFNASSSSSDFKNTVRDTGPFHLFNKWGR